MYSAYHPAPDAVPSCSIVMDFSYKERSTHICSSDSVAIGSHFSDVDVIEVEHILGLFLEWSLSTFGLLQWMLDDLVLVAVQRDEHFRFGVCTVDRIGLRGDRVVDF